MSDEYEFTCDCGAIFNREPPYHPRPEKCPQCGALDFITTKQAEENERINHYEKGI